MYLCKELDQSEEAIKILESIMILERRCTNDTFFYFKYI